MGTEREMSHRCPFAANGLRWRSPAQFLSPPAAGRSYAPLSPPETGGQLDLLLHAPPKGKGKVRSAAPLDVSPDAWRCSSSRFGPFHPKPAPPGDNSQKPTPIPWSYKQTPSFSVTTMGETSSRTSLRRSMKFTQPSGPQQVLGDFGFHHIWAP